MPWPAYSERILSSSGHVGWQFTTVPVGRRVVVKHVAVSKFNAVSTYLQVAIAAAAVWSRSLPGDLAGFQDAVMWVAYGGEQVGIYMDGINAGVALAGYVFDDLAGARAELDPVEAQLAAAAGAEDLGPWSM